MTIFSKGALTGKSVRINCGSGDIRGFSMMALNSVKRFNDTQESKEGMRAFQVKRTPDFHSLVK